MYNKNIRTISGPNLYPRNPVLMMTLELEERAAPFLVEIFGTIGKRRPRWRS